jgi:hypothetical protein
VLEDCTRLSGGHGGGSEAHIEAALSGWSLTPVVEALQALRGLALVAQHPGTRHNPLRKSTIADRSFPPALQRKHATPGRSPRRIAARRMLIRRR